MSNSKVRARRRRRANKAWKKTMGFVVFTETAADSALAFEAAVHAWARTVEKQWAEKGTLSDEAKNFQSIVDLSL